MKRLKAITAAFLVALTGTLLPFASHHTETTPPAVYAAETVSTVTVEGKIDYDASFKCLELINKERAASGLSALTMDEQFLDIAVSRAAEISLYYEHDHADGGTMQDLFEGMYGAFAENIAYGFSTAESVTEAWLNSEGHRANIMNSAFKSIGIAYFTSADGTGFWVQVFQSNSADEVSKTGTEYISEPIDVLSKYLDITAYAANINDSGTEKQINVYNENTSSYTLTKLNPSDFSFECTTPNTAEVDSDGKITVKYAGNVNITVSLKSDPDVSYTLSFRNTVNNVELTPETEHHTIIVAPYSLGDVNGDGLVDSSDASAVLAYYSQIATGKADYFTSKQKSAGDVNTDSAIDSADASSILSYYSLIATGGNITMTEFMA